MLENVQSTVVKQFLASNLFKEICLLIREMI